MSLYKTPQGRNVISFASATLPMERKARVEAERIIQKWIDGSDLVHGRVSPMNGRERLHVDQDILYSYSTPIAVMDRGAGTVYLSNERYSNTTSSQQRDVKSVASGNGYTVEEVNTSILQEKINTIVRLSREERNRLKIQKEEEEKFKQIQEDIGRGIKDVDWDTAFELGDDTEPKPPTTASMLREAPGRGIVNEDIWEKAKKAADKSYNESDGDKYWAVVSTIYKNMGGKYKSKQAQVEIDDKLDKFISDQLMEYYLRVAPKNMTIGEFSNSIVDLLEKVGMAGMNAQETQEYMRTHHLLMNPENMTLEDDDLPDQKYVSGETTVI